MFQYSSLFENILNSFFDKKLHWLEVAFLIWNNIESISFG